MNIKDIRNRAQGAVPGTVTEGEVEYARTILATGRGDISSALYVVGLCGNTNDTRLIEPYLFGAERNVYGELALKALCRYLGLVETYKDLLRTLIMSDENIGWRNSRMTAINLADVYFKEFDDDAVGCRLLDIMTSKDDSERDTARFILIDVLNLRSKLTAPFETDLDNAAADTRKIIDAAKIRFGCTNLG